MSHGCCEDGIILGMAGGCTQWVLNINDLSALLSPFHYTMVLSPLEGSSSSHFWASPPQYLIQQF